MIEDKYILGYSGLTYYDERIKDYIDNGISGSTLHAGDHITIDGNNRISAVYESSDFDISGLTDSQNLRETWSGKQDALSAGTGIIIDANNVISVNKEEIAEIDDEVTETGKTWSSYKINSELDNKSNTGHTHIIGDISGLSEEFKNYYTTGNTYTKTEVDGLIAAIDQFHYEIYADLSGVTDPQSNVLYLIGPSGTGNDKYEEYVYTNNSFTKIGDTTIDLSGYATISALTEGLNGKSDTSHTHTISDVTDLQDSLDSKSDTGHTHEQYSLTSHTHTAAEVGALPSDTFIPSKTSDITNDSGFITGFTETDPTVHAWAKAENKPTYDVSEISGLTEELNNKSNTGHTHQIQEVSGLTEIVAEIDGKQDILSPGNHILISANNEIDTTGVVASQYIASIWRGTQAEYDALSSYDNNTLYVITQ